jgi:hypothetical protein
MRSKNVAILGISMAVAYLVTSVVVLVGFESEAWKPPALIGAFDLIFNLLLLFPPNFFHTELYLTYSVQILAIFYKFEESEFDHYGLIQIAIYPRTLLLM